MLYPLLKLRLDLRQVNEDVLGLSYLWCCLALGTEWLNQLNSVDKLAASIALISLSIWVVAQGALTLDKSVSKECLAFRAIVLLDHLLEGLALAVQVVENVLGYLSLLWGRGSTKVVEITVKPLVDCSMDGVILITDLLWCHIVLSCLGLGGCAVLISTANVDCIVACEAGKASIGIRGKDTANDVSKMWHIVHIGQGTCDEDVAPAFTWQDLLTFVYPDDLCI